MSASFVGAAARHGGCAPCVEIACKSHVKLQRHEVGSDPLRSWPRTVHTHTAPDRGAASQSVESEAYAERQMLPPEHSAEKSATEVRRGSLVLVGQSKKASD